ncbi:MAG: SRPBCC family protein [Chloroflexota bacterium]|nr:SRPBCC family protein [Chloroflexota bacterium]
MPVEGSVEVAMPVEALWHSFRRVRGWPAWNGCMWTATVTGGELAEGQTLIWAFHPLRRYLPYRLPAIARLTEVVPERRVTWEVTLMPGFHARHTYWMEPIDAQRSRFGSWEVAEGPMYRLLRAFWLAHFRFVCRESLHGADRLAEREARRAARR